MDEPTPHAPAADAGTWSRLARLPSLDAQDIVESVLQDLPIGVAIVDRQMRFVLANRRWIADHRISDQDVIGRAYYDVFPESADRWRRIHQRCLGGAVEKCDGDRLEYPDGSVEWVSWEVRPWLRGHGAIEGLVLMHEFITPRKQVEDSLRTSVSRLSALVENLHGAIVVEDDRRHVYHANRAFCSLFVPGAQPDQLVDADCSRLAEQVKSLFVDPLGFVARVREILQQKRVVIGERLKMADERVLERDYVPIFVGQEYRGHLWMYRDVTEQQKSADVLRLLADLGSALVGSLDIKQTLAPVGSLLVPTFADMCWLDVLEGESLLKRVSASNDQALQPELEAVLSQGAPSLHSNSPIAEVIRTGRTLVLSNVGEPTLKALISNPQAVQEVKALGLRSVVIAPVIVQGKPQGALTCFSRKDAWGDEAPLMEEVAHRCALAIENSRLFGEAVQAIEAREIFLSIAAHELKTPIAALQLLSQSVLRKAQKDPTSELALAGVVPTLAMVENQGRRLVKLVENLLDLSRILCGRVRLELETFDLADMVRDVTAQLSKNLEEAGVPLEVYMEGPIEGRWDRLRLEQVLNNLLTNAFKFGNGKPVTVEAGQRDDRVWFSVTDRGVGISPDEQARIFERFEQVGVSRRAGGLGLGLWIVRQIVDRMGGTIQVRSQPGEGSKFTVELPRLSTEPPAGGTY